MIALSCYTFLSKYEKFYVYESQVRYWAFSFIRVVQAFTRMNIIGHEICLHFRYFINILFMELIFYTFRILEDLFFYVYKFIFKKINLARQLEPKFPSRDRTYSIYIFTLLKTNEVHLSCNFRYRHKATCTS